MGMLDPSRSLTRPDGKALDPADANNHGASHQHGPVASRGPISDCQCGTSGGIQNTPPGRRIEKISIGALAGVPSPAASGRYSCALCEKLRMWLVIRAMSRTTSPRANSRRQESLRRAAVKDGWGAYCSDDAEPPVLVHKTGRSIHKSRQRRRAGLTCSHVVQGCHQVRSGAPKRGR